jgi:hypothetical protein
MIEVDLRGFAPNPIKAKRLPLAYVQTVVKKSKNIDKIEFL